MDLGAWLKLLDREKVRVPKSKPYVSFIGEEGRASETVITWHDKASDKDADGNEIGTFGTASVTVESDYFGAREVTFEVLIISCLCCKISQLNTRLRVNSGTD